MLIIPRNFFNTMTAEANSTYGIDCVLIESLCSTRKDFNYLPLLISKNRYKC